MASGVVFLTDPNVSFVAGLARWAAEPQQPAAEAQPAADGAEPAAERQPTAFEAECLKLESAKQYGALSEKLGAVLRERFATADEADIENGYTILLQLLVQWGLLGEKALPLADELCSSTSERAMLRRTLLLSIYSLVQRGGHDAARFPLLLRLLKFCTAAKLLDPLLGGAAQRTATVESWVKEWELDEGQKKELWGLIFDAYASDAAATYQHALQYLPLHNGTQLKNQPELRGRIVQCLLTTLRGESLHNCDKLAQLPIVGQLGADAEFAPLDRLLQIFAREMYDDYLKFYANAANAKFMASHGLEHGVCQRKMRLLSLCSLGRSSKELPYASVASALQIGADEVESWVMEANASGLIVAKMDQMREIVIVSTALEREFGAKQWEQLGDNLKEWTQSISGLLTLVQQSKA